MDKPFPREADKYIYFFGKYFLSNGHVYFLLFLFGHDFMAQDDVTFVILNSWFVAV